MVEDNYLISATIQFILEGFLRMKCYSKILVKFNYFFVKHFNRALKMSKTTKSYWLALPIPKKLGFLKLCLLSQNFDISPNFIKHLKSSLKFYIFFMVHSIVSPLVLPFCLSVSFPIHILHTHKCMSACTRLRAHTQDFEIVRTSIVC